MEIFTTFKTFKFLSQKFPSIWKKFSKCSNTSTLIYMVKISSEISALLLNDNEKNATSLSVILEFQKQALADILGHPSDSLHVTLKQVENDKTYTIGRSTTSGLVTRNMAIGRNDSMHEICKNSSFASTMRISDGKIDWKDYDFPWFICDNLNKSKSYASDGTNWKNHYNSTITVPVTRRTETGDAEIVGHLTLDSKDSLFSGMNIYHYLANDTEYLKFSTKPVVLMMQCFANMWSPVIKSNKQT